MLSIIIDSCEYGNDGFDTDEITFMWLKNEKITMNGTEYTCSWTPKEQWNVTFNGSDRDFFELTKTIEYMNHCIRQEVKLADIGLRGMADKMHEIKDNLDRVELESAMSMAGACYTYADNDITPTADDLDGLKDTYRACVSIALGIEE